MIELGDPATDLLIDFVNWDVRPKETHVDITDERGEVIEKQRVTKVQRKDGLWQVVPMSIEQVMVVYAFATFGRA